MKNKQTILRVTSPYRPKSFFDRFIDWSWLVFATFCCAIWSAFALILLALFAARMWVEIVATTTMLESTTWELQTPSKLQKYYTNIYDFYNIPILDDNIQLPSSRKDSLCTTVKKGQFTICYGGYGIGHNVTTTLKDLWLWKNKQKEWKLLSRNNTVDIIPGQTAIWSIGDHVFMGVDQQFYYMPSILSPTSNFTWIQTRNTSFPEVYGTVSYWVTNKDILWLVDSRFTEIHRLNLFYDPHTKSFKMLEDWITKKMNPQIPYRDGYTLWPNYKSFGSFYIFGGTTHYNECKPEVLLYEWKAGWTILHNGTQESNHRIYPLNPGCRINAVPIPVQKSQYLYFYGGSDYSDIWAFHKKAMIWKWLGGSHEQNVAPFQHPSWGHQLPSLSGISTWYDHRGDVYIFGGAFQNNTVYYNLVWRLSKKRYI